MIASNSVENNIPFLASLAADIALQASTSVVLLLRVVSLASADVAID